LLRFCENEKAHDHPSSSIPIIGIPQHVSPERLKGKRNADESADSPYAPFAVRFNPRRAQLLRGRLALKTPRLNALFQQMRRGAD